MDRAETYRKNAEQAERQASLATNEIERAAYGRIAQGWRDLEESERRRQQRGV
jgi:hypothetical protein